MIMQSLRCCHAARDEWEKPGTISKLGISGEAVSILANLKQLQHLDLWLHARSEPHGEC